MNPQAEANQIYAPALQAIQQQTPQIQQLYQTLVQGLQQQVAAQQQNVLQSAQQRGVAAPTLAGQIAGAYGQDMNLISAQLNAQRATDTAGINQQLGKTNVAKAGSVNDLAQSLLKQNMENQQNAYQMSDIERKAALEQQQNQQRFEIQKAQYERAQAERRAAEARARSSSRSSGGGKSLTDLSESDIARALRIKLSGVKGSDGHVSPENLAYGLKIWRQAGLADKSFWSNFQGLWNPKQGTYNDEFQYFLGR